MGKSGSKPKPMKKTSPPTQSKASSRSRQATDSAKKGGSRESRAAAQTTHSEPAVASTASKAAPEPQESPQLPLASGKVSVFGGPKDRGLKPDDRLDLPTGPHFVYEQVRTLNPKSFYCSMRWQYQVLHMTREEVKRWWANKKILITNPKNKTSIVARAVDWGPHENTGFDVGVSPGAAEALGVEAGDEIEVSMADPKAPLGVL